MTYRLLGEYIKVNYNNASFRYHRVKNKFIFLELNLKNIRLKVREDLDWKRETSVRKIL